MADGVAITAGSGTTILTDDTGAGGHAQVVKLAIATDGSGTLIPADGTDGLLVNLGANNDVAVTGTVTANLAAGTNNIGDVDVLSIAAGDNNIGNVDIVTVPAPLSTTGTGTEATALRVTIATDSTGVLSVDDNGASLTVDGTVTANLAAGTNNIGDVDVLTVPAPLSTTGGGTEATALRVTLASDSTGVVSVDDNGGALTVDGTVTANLAAGTNNIGDVDVLTGPTGTSALQFQGAIAHDSAESTANPLYIGGSATTGLSGITLVANDDVTHAHFGVDGVLITRPHAPLEDLLSGNASNTDGASTQVIAAQAAGVKTYLLAFTVTNTSSSGTYCEIKDGTTVKFTVPVPANGGVTVNLPVPIAGTAATAWNFDMGAATTTAYCSMVGFKSKV